MKCTSSSTVNFANISYMFCNFNQYILQLYLKKHHADISNLTFPFVVRRFVSGMSQRASAARGQNSRAKWLATAKNRPLIICNKTTICFCEIVCFKIVRLSAKVAVFVGFKNRYVQTSRGHRRTDHISRLFRSCCCCFRVSWRVSLVENSSLKEWNWQRQATEILKLQHITQLTCKFAFKFAKNKRLIDFSKVALYFRLHSSQVQV